MILKKRKILKQIHNGLKIIMIKKKKMKKKQTYMELEKAMLWDKND